MTSYLDNCRFVPTAGGLGDWEVSAAVQGYMDDIEAGAEDAVEYNCRAQSGNQAQWEISKGLYDSVTRTFARTTVLYSSNAGAKVNFTEVPEVGIVLLKANLPRAYTGDLAPTLDAPDDSFYVQRSNQDFWMRENGVWVRKGNIRDEGAGGIVGVNSVVAQGFMMGVQVQRIRYLEGALFEMGLDLAVVVDRIREIAVEHGLGYAMQVELTRIKELAAQHNMGFLMDVTLTITEADLESIVAEMALGFTFEVALARTQFVSAEHALGFSQANDLTHGDVNQMLLSVGFDTGTAAAYFQFYDVSYADIAAPSTPPTGVLGCCAFSHDKQKVAISSAASVFVYDLSSGAPVHITTLTSILTSNNATLSWSPDDSRLLIVNAGAVLIYNTSSWTTVTAPTVASSAAVSGDWSPDGGTIVIGCNASPFVRLFQTSDMSAITNPSTQPTTTVSTVKFSPDGDWLAAAYSSGSRFSIFDRNNSYTKLTDHATVPAGSVGARRSSVAFNSTGTKVVISTNSTPFIWAYDISGTTLTKEASPSVTPTTNSIGGAFSKDDAHYFCSSSANPRLMKYTVSGWTKDTDISTQPGATKLLLCIDNTT